MTIANEMEYTLSRNNLDSWNDEIAISFTNNETGSPVNTIVNNPELMEFNIIDRNGIYTPINRQLLNPRIRLRMLDSNWTKHLTETEIAMIKVETETPCGR